MFECWGNRIIFENFDFLHLIRIWRQEKKQRWYDFQRTLRKFKYGRATATFLEDIWPAHFSKTMLMIIERKIIFALGDAPGDAGELANYTFRKRSFPLYSEDQKLSGTRAKLPTQRPGRMFEQTSSLDFQMDGTNFNTEWKRNTALEEMEKKSETYYTVLSERLIRAGSMIWTVLRPLTITLNVKHKADKGDKGTWTTVCKDLDLDISNGKLKSIWWSVQTPRGTISVLR